MQSVSERALAALFLRLSALRGPVVLRNHPLSVDVQAGGLLILRDGDPGEPQVTMSPPTYHFQHVAELEIFVDTRDADAAFDALRLRVAGVLAVDRTLGGVIDWLEAGAPAPVDLPITGADALKAAVIPITLHYATSDPLI